MLSKPKVFYSIMDNKLAYFLKERWSNFNVKIYDNIQKRKLRSAILNDNYDKTFELIVNYERFSGSNEVTRKIKNYATYNMINDKFINSTIIAKI